MRFKSSICCFCTAVFFFCAHLTADLVQWPSADGGNDHWYEAVVVEAPITWEEADALAVSSGAYLATITSAAENDFVFGLIDNHSEYWQNTATASIGPWIGGIQTDGSAEPAGGWSWATGEVFGYANWAPGEPNNSATSGGNENRIHFFMEGINNVAPTWNDIHNNFQIRAYVRELDSNGLLLGDVNLDCVVNLLDVDSFIERLASGMYQPEADCNEDGVVDLLDVDPFITLLAGN